MRWSLWSSAAILIVIPVFSTPIPRMVLRRRGLFEQTLHATGSTVDELAAKVANALTDDPRPCEFIVLRFRQTVPLIVVSTPKAHTSSRSSSSSPKAKTPGA